MPSIYDWSKTADDNGAADAVAPWPEQMLRKQVNNSARGGMKRVAEFRDDISGALLAGGSANALTITPNSDMASLANGRVVAFRAAAANTGATTLNVNGLGAKAIRKIDSTGDVALAGSEIQANGLYLVMYGEALNGGAGAWCLLNPSLSAAIYALSGLVTVDNTVPRFNGIAGAFQTSGVTIDDSNNVTGIAAFTTSGNITAGGGIISTSGVFTAGASTFVIIGNSSTGLGIRIRPVNTASTVGQVSIDTNGNMTISGTLTVTG